MFTWCRAVCLTGINMYASATRKPRTNAQTKMPLPACLAPNCEMWLPLLLPVPLRMIGIVDGTLLVCPAAAAVPHAPPDVLRVAPQPPLEELTLAADAALAPPAGMSVTPASARASPCPYTTRMGGGDGMRYTGR